MARRDKPPEAPEDHQEAELVAGGSADVEKPPPVRGMNAQEATPMMPQFSKTARERILTMVERDEKTQLTEMGMAQQIVGQLAIAEADKTRLLELFLRFANKEGLRRNDLELSQRQYMWFMMADKERDMGHIKDLTEAVIGMADKYAAVQQQQAASKVGEAMEVISVVSQLPLMVALQELALEKLQRKKALKNSEKEKLRKKLQAQIRALEEEEQEE